MALSFNQVQFDVVDREGQPWLRSIQIGDGLGYENPRQAIHKLYDSNSDEFTDSMTALVKIPTAGGEQETRIFSPRGCHLLAMLVRTPIAKAFRKWVLDVLDRIAKEESEKDAKKETCESAAITPEQQRTLQKIIDAKVRQASDPDSPIRRELYALLWHRLKNHFLIAKYQQLPQTKFVDAVSFLVQQEIEPRKKKVALEEKQERNLPMALTDDKYENFIHDVEAFRAETAAKIEILLHRGLNFVDAKKLGAGGIIAFTPILLDWLQRIAGQPNPILRRNELISRAIDYSPLYLLRHMEEMRPQK